jgi:predicted anti-sigma-YlaC factor YlaD
MSHLKRNLIQAFLDQELSDKEKNLLERHLSACSGCRSELQRATSERNWIMSELALLNPDRIPPCGDFIVHSKEIGKNRFMEKFIFAPVKVPLFCLVVLGSIIIILAGLLYSDKSKMHALNHGQPQESNESFITIITENEITSIPFVISPKNFVPIKNPRILSDEEDFDEK